MRNKKFIIALLSATMILGTSITAYADSAYVIGAELPELFVNDSELSDGWHWVYDGTDSGGVNCVYIQNGKRLRGTTTPDGYNVSMYDGEWYTWDEGMPVTKVINYQYSPNKFPFSNTGTLIENDYLGIKMSYTPEDLANGFDGWFGNWAGAMGYRFMSVEFGKEIGLGSEMVSFSIETGDKGNIETANQRAETFHKMYLDGFSFTDTVVCEYTICGKQFYGTKDYWPDGKGDVIAYKLYHTLPTGQSLCVDIQVLSDEALQTAIDFMNTHMTIS